ncbi:ABC transporter ATP-binding protein [Janibacter sp. G1551]|uniref:ABC transporter ATP-binding protein n=1 Tax=Janibacter sp. G1551 TaxID=3420440 RepID=UPI003D06401F
MTRTRTLTAEALSVSFGQRPVIDGLDLAVPPGEVTIIIGANASGKSTLLRTMARILRPASGAVTLDGRAVHETPSRELAKVLGLLPQSPLAPDGITVRDLVSRGRHPHQGLFRAASADDAAAVARALAAAGVTDLADRPVDALSGGQRQRAWIAMALAQEPEVLLLDEPTTYLDVAHQIDVLDCVADLNEQRGTTVVIVLHELALAARYADHLVALSRGRIVAAGPPRDVLDADLVREVFGIDAVVVPDPVTGAPLVVPRSRRHQSHHQPEHAS